MIIQKKKLQTFRLTVSGENVRMFVKTCDGVYIVRRVYRIDSKEKEKRRCLIG